MVSPAQRGFLLSLGAGLSTLIGGSCVYFVERSNRIFLSICLASSAGVMSYVSLVALFPEGLDKVQKSLESMKTLSSDEVNLYAYSTVTVCFFLGWMLVSFIDFLISLLIEKAHLKQHAAPSDNKSENDERVDMTTTGFSNHPHSILINQADCEKEGIRTEISEKEIETGTILETESPTIQQKIKHFASSIFCMRTKSLQRNPSKLWAMQHADECFKKDTRTFLKTGLFTAIALTLHNLPEGAATYTGTLSSPSMGITLAVAIALHNIPEGFSVSVPLYYGTGNKHKAFMYSVLTGLAEPLGAGIAWIAFGDNPTPLVLGISFSVISGIMTNVALKELLPNAIKYDPCDQVTSTSLVAGMIFIATSLVALTNFSDSTVN